MNHFRCLLPGGYIDAAGERHRQVELRPLNGHAELAIAEGLPGPALVSQLLELTITRVGPFRASAQLVRQLLVADRQYLLLQLRLMTQGERIAAVLTCPQPACGHTMDIDFALDEIPIKRVDQLAATYHLGQLDGTGDSAPAVLIAHQPPPDHHPSPGVIFRLPNGGDQELLVPLLQAQRDEEAASLLLQQCILQIDRVTPTPAQIAALPAATCQAIQQTMVAAAPEITLTMAGTCPTCGVSFELPFDLEHFILQELQLSVKQLYREIHFLAFHYHWSERELMQLPRRRRRQYIEVLTSALEK